MSIGRIISLFLLLSCWGNAAYAAPSAEELAAAETTYIHGLKLLPASQATQVRGFRFAYVEQDTSPGGGRYQCGALNAQQADQAARIVANAFHAMDESAWAAITLDYVLLCSRAAAGGQEIGGIPVPPIKLLMLGTGSNPASSPRLPYTALHELFHLIEMQNSSYQDAAWDQEFTGYAHGYGATAGSTLVGSGGAGFINGYAKSFPHEERAEIFAIQLLSGDALSAYITRKNDTVLARKKTFILRKCAQLLGAKACG